MIKQYYLPPNGPKTSIPFTKQYILLFDKNENKKYRQPVIAPELHAHKRTPVKSKRVRSWSLFAIRHFSAVFGFVRGCASAGSGLGGDFWTFFRERPLFGFFVLKRMVCLHFSDTWALCYVLTTCV